MTTYWLNFARTGYPNGPAVPAWPTVAEAAEHVMEFGVGGSVVSPRPCPVAIDFWLSYDGPIA